MVSEVAEVLKQFGKLAANFELVAAQVQRIEDRQIELLGRIARLEERIDTVNESARSAAQTGVAQLESRVVERITRLEERGASGRIPETGE